MVDIWKRQLTDAISTSLVDHEWNPALKIVKLRLLGVSKLTSTLR
jgi:hypothetical protein